MSTTEDAPPAADLRTRIFDHLTDHPGLTRYRLARALRDGETRIRRALPAMERDGLLVHEVAPKTTGTATPVTRWSARTETAAAAETRQGK